MVYSEEVQIRGALESAPNCNALPPPKRSSSRSTTQSDLLSLPRRSVSYEERQEAIKQWSEGLNSEQLAILSKVIMGDNVFFTGAAGTGKSFLIERIVGALRQTLKMDVVIAAPTGVAACNIGGQTLHSVLGIGLLEGPALEVIKHIKRQRAAAVRWRKTQVLIIDEISMVSDALFDTLNEVGQRLRVSSRPWGGIQLITCGDFCQIPPVTRGNAPGDYHFAFLGRSWAQTFAPAAQFVLRQVYRQRDAEHAAMLDQLRVGVVTDAALRAIGERQRLTEARISERGNWLQISPAVRKRLEEGEDVPQDELYCPLQLFPRKNTGTEINNQLLQLLPLPEVIYTAVDKAPVAAMSVRLDKMSLLGELRLRVGAQVMLLRNLSVQRGLVNGSVGIVRAFFRGGRQASMAGSPAALYTGFSLYTWLPPETLDYIRDYALCRQITAQRAQSQPPQFGGTDYLTSVLCGCQQLLELVQRYQSGEPKPKSPVTAALRDQAFRPPAIGGKDDHFGPAFVMVEFSGEIYPIFADSVSVSDSSAKAERHQIPLTLAYAMTIHKAQGKTLNDAFIDLTDVFNDCPAQGYVAISRVRRLDGLWIRGFSPHSIRASSMALDFYRKLEAQMQEQAAKAETEAAVLPSNELPPPPEKQREVSIKDLLPGPPRQQQAPATAVAFRPRARVQVMLGAGMARNVPDNFGVGPGYRREEPLLESPPQPSITGCVFQVAGSAYLPAANVNRMRQSSPLSPCFQY